VVVRRDLRHSFSALVLVPPRCSAFASAFPCFESQCPRLPLLRHDHHCPVQGSSGRRARVAVLVWSSHHVPRQSAFHHRGRPLLAVVAPLACLARMWCTFPNCTNPTWKLSVSATTTMTGCSIKGGPFVPTRVRFRPTSSRPGMSFFPASSTQFVCVSVSALVPVARAVRTGGILFVGRIRHANVLVCSH
jgi:hypothetical protein